ncbi:MAG: hypothetical protein HY033_08940 [Ignavibacteriae bacterium]|nr:hypothetical protein [Ignavibacteria bacterium]MBI3365017.1 hypothetical protein [Ignavibacteriota bacterium]
MNFDLSTETRQQRRISYRQFVNEFLAFAEVTYAPGTTKIYRSTFPNFGRVVGDLPLRSITPQHVDKIVWKNESIRVAQHHLTLGG